jgi:hypothetical protein
MTRNETELDLWLKADPDLRKRLATPVILGEQFVEMFNKHVSPSPACPDGPPVVWIREG